MQRRKSIRIYSSKISFTQNYRCISYRSFSIVIIHVTKINNKINLIALLTNAKIDQIDVFN